MTIRIRFRRSWRNHTIEWRNRQASCFLGDMSRRHMRLIVRLLLDQGYRIAYIDRADGHVIPFATRITSGDWAGWWRLDLVELRISGR